MRNTKGFTLVELLAVIVILAVVMLIAVSAIGPLMTRAQKGALGSEGLAMIKGAKSAYQLEQMKTKGPIKSTSTVCFSLNWLYNNGYFEKGSTQGYTGSVLVTYSNGNYSYEFWISNETYVYSKVNQTAYNPENATDGKTASETCGTGLPTGTVKCTATGTAKGSCA